MLLNGTFKCLNRILNALITVLTVRKKVRTKWLHLSLRKYRILQNGLMKKLYEDLYEAKPCLWDIFDWDHQKGKRELKGNSVTVNPVLQGSSAGNTYNNIAVNPVKGRIYLGLALEGLMIWWYIQLNQCISITAFFKHF